MINLLSRRALLSEAAATAVASRMVRGATISKNIDISVTPAAPRGPQPIPQPYPAQPGYTQVADLSAIKAAGNYQLTADWIKPMVSYAPIPGVTLDAGGHIITGYDIRLSQGCALKNAAVLNTTIGINQDGVTIANCSIVYNIKPYPWLLLNIVNGQNITIQNNLFQGGTTDDLIVCYFDRNADAPVIGLQILNNIFYGAPDCAIEWVTRKNNNILQNNQFGNCNIAMGDFVDSELYNCKFQDNQAQKSSVTHMFFFQTSADDDATASSYWAANGNSFARNTWV
jgi:hypothetical protein